MPGFKGRVIVRSCASRGDGIRRFGVIDTSLNGKDKFKVAVNIKNPLDGVIDRYYVDACSRETRQDVLFKIPELEWAYNEKLNAYAIIGYSGKIVEGMPTKEQFENYSAYIDPNYARQRDTNPKNAGVGFEILSFDAKTMRLGFEEIIDDRGKKIQLNQNNLAVSPDLELLIATTNYASSHPNDNTASNLESENWSTKITINGQEFDLAKDVFNDYSLSGVLNYHFAKNFSELSKLGSAVVLETGSENAIAGGRISDDFGFANGHPNGRVAWERMRHELPTPASTTFSPLSAPTNQISFLELEGMEKNVQEISRKLGKSIVHQIRDSLPAFAYFGVLASAIKIRGGAKAIARGKRTSTKGKGSIVGKRMATAHSQRAAKPQRTAKNGIKAIIFDLDGVLANSEPLHLKSFNKLFSNYNVKISKKEWHSNYTGTGSRHIISDLAKRHNLKIDIEKVMEERKRLFQQYVMQGKIKRMPGAKQLVNWAREHKLKMIVASGGHRENVKAQLRALGFKMPAIALEDVKHRKPSPEAFIKAASKLGIPPSQCLVIEDSNAGVLAAKRAGMKVLLVSRIPIKARKLATKSAKSLKSKSVKSWLSSLIGKNPKKPKSKPWKYLPPKNAGENKQPF